MANTADYKVIAFGGEWPEGFQIAVRDDGVIDAAEKLAATEEFDPVVLVVGRDLPGGPLGRFLLLPREQAERWRSAAPVCNGEPAGIIAKLHGR